MASKQNNVKVMVKVRPLIGREIESQEKICWDKTSDNEIIELDATTPSKPCIYDHVFGGTDTTQSLYEMAISQIVDSCVQGFNGSVMAYGQTASGKTYTMMGDEQNKGIIRLVAENIFDIVEKHDDRDIYMVRCSFLEIYNEKINDLLAPEKTNLEVFETPDGAVMIKEATEKVVRKATNVLDLIEQGNAAKRMEETAMNDRSSRSHTIFRIMIESQEAQEDGATIKMGILDLVDLAGSESVNKTNATGDRFKEGISINKSLLELGRVIKELSEKKEGEDKFIVFRNSKLTRVIQHSLGGNAKSVVICTVSPAEREETRNTLRFASRAKNVKNSPKLNEILSDQAMIKRLNQKITGLHKQIAEMARQSAGVGYNAGATRQDIIDRIERCEMQFIRSKKSSRRQNLRRQTWHSLGHEQNSRQDSEESEQDSLRALMPPPPPIFTTQRGTNANHHHETFDMPNFDVEKFEPGENMSFTQSPSPKRVCNRIHTPIIFRQRLSAIIEGVTSPAIGAVITMCDRCKELEAELNELSDFTKLEQMYHVHEESDRHSCEDVIEQLRADLDEAHKMLDSNNEEIISLKNSVEKSQEILETAVRDKSDAIKAKEVAESQCGGIEYELEALKSRFEKREIELLGLLGEKPIDKNSRLDQNAELTAKIDEIQAELDATKTAMKELKQKNKTLQTEYDDTSMQLVEALQDYDALKAEHEKIGTEETELQTMLNASKAKNDELQEQLEREQKQIEIFKHELDELRGTLEKLVPMVAAKEELNVQYQDLMKKSLEMTESLREKDREIEALGASLSETREALSNNLLLHGQKMTEEEQEEMKIKIDELETENNEKKVENESLLTKIESLEAQIQAEISEKERLVAELKNTETIKEEFERTRSELQIMTDELNKANAGLSDFEGKIKEVLEQLSTVEAEKQDLEKTVVEMKEKIEEKSAEDHFSSELIEKIQELEAKSVETEENVQKLSSEKISLVQEISSLKAELSQMSELNEKIRAMEEKCQKMSQLQETLGSLSIGLNEMEAQVTTLTAEKEELLASISSLKSEMSLNGSESSSLISELRQEISLLEEKCQNPALLVNLKEFEAQIELLTAEKSLLMQEMEKLKLQVVHNGTESNLITELNDKIKDLEAKCQNFHAKSLESASLAQTLNEVEDHMRDLTDEKESLERQLTVLKEEKSLLEQELEKLQSESEQESSNKIADLQENIQEMEEKCRFVEEKSVEGIKSLENQILAVNSEKEALLETISSLKLNENETSGVISGLKQEIQDLQAKSVESGNILQDMEGQVNALSTEKESLLDEKEELLATISSLRSEMALSGSESCSLIAELKEKIQVLEEKCQDLSEKSSDSDLMETEVQKLTAEVAKIGTERQEMEVKLKEQADKIEILQHELLEAIDKIHEKESEVSVLESQLQTTGNEVQQLQQQLSCLVESHQKTSFDYESVINELKSQLNSSKEQFSSEMSSIMAENSQFKTENADLTMKLATVEEKLALLNQQIANLEVNHAQAMAELASSKALIKELQSKMSLAEKEFEKMQQNLVLKDQKLKEMEQEREQHTKDLFELNDLRKKTVKDRRSRRQSAHDELRPLVRSIKAISCQTDPTDENCQCREMNEKLEKQKIELIKAKVKVDHYRLGIDQKVGDVKEEKEKVEAKLKEAVTEVNRLHQEGARIRKERETLREKLTQMDAEFRRYMEKSRLDKSCKDTQTDMQMPFAVNMNSDAVSLEQKLHIKKLEDDLAQTAKKYQECKKIAQDRREKIREKEMEIAALRNRSPEGGKENNSNNSQVSQLTHENSQLKKENSELIQHYQHYKSLYQAKTAQLHNTMKQETPSKSEPSSSSSSEDHSTLLAERDAFEKKYRKAVTLFNVAKKSLEDYKSTYVICVAENRALGTILNRYDKDFTLSKPLTEIDEMYQKGYEEWKRQNPALVNKYKLED